MKRLLAFTEGADFVCYRYRLAAFRDSLAAVGWRLDLLPRPHGLRGVSAALVEMAAADAVVVQRRLLSGPKRWLVRRAAKVLVYDFDDAIYLKDSNRGQSADDSVRRGRFRGMLRTADLCLAGSTHLHDQATRSVDAAKVHRMPTCVDPNRCPLADHDRAPGSVTLAWIGSQSTLPALVEAHDCLRAAATAVPNLTLDVICDTFPRLAGVRLRETRWSAATEAAALARADIGVSWLPDHPWSLGKCGLKVLQYMAAGLPVVANAVGIHRELVADGETGFLANDPAAWRRAVVTLAGDPDLRRRMGREGRRRVERDWSVATWGPRFAAILDAAVVRGSRRTGAAA
ncbi:MAG: glycosyltransferase [Planctomycetia bacterium]|nr:glycosyltransferase [Planctomycetia bacterium]